MSKSKFEIEGFDFSTGELVGKRTYADGEVEAGRLQIHQGEEGKPITGELVDADFVEGQRRTMELTSLTGRKGPAQVATPRYRRNYEAIFKKTPTGKPDLDCN